MTGSLNRRKRVARGAGRSRGLLERRSLAAETRTADSFRGRGSGGRDRQGDSDGSGDAGGQGDGEDDPVQVPTLPFGALAALAAALAGGAWRAGAVSSGREPSRV